MCRPRPKCAAGSYYISDIVDILFPFHFFLRKDVEDERARQACQVGRIGRKEGEGMRKGSGGARGRTPWRSLTHLLLL